MYSVIVGLYSLCLPVLVVKQAAYPWIACIKAGYTWQEAWHVTRASRDPPTWLGLTQGEPITARCSYIAHLLMRPIISRTLVLFYTFYCACWCKILKEWPTPSYRHEPVGSPWTPWSGTRTPRPVPDLPSQNNRLVSGLNACLLNILLVCLPAQS